MIFEFRSEIKMPIIIARLGEAISSIVEIPRFARNDRSHYAQTGEHGAGSACAVFSLVPSPILSFRMQRSGMRNLAFDRDCFVLIAIGMGESNSHPRTS